MPRRPSISNQHPRWAELVEAVQDARVAEGFTSRAAFARSIGIDDSTMALIEGAKPGKVSEDMLEAVTRRLGWERGEWERLLTGESDTPSTDPIRSAPESVLLAELLRRANQREGARTSAAG